MLGTMHAEQSLATFLLDLSERYGRLGYSHSQFMPRMPRLEIGSYLDFPMGVEAPKGAPNIPLILTDDIGFGASSTFGGPIQTSNRPRFGHGADPPTPRSVGHARRKD